MIVVAIKFNNCVSFRADIDEARSLHEKNILEDVFISSILHRL